MREGGRGGKEGQEVEVREGRGKKAVKEGRRWES